MHCSKFPVLFSEALNRKPVAVCASVLAQPDGSLHHDSTDPFGAKLEAVTPINKYLPSEVSRLIRASIHASSRVSIHIYCLLANDC